MNLVIPDALFRELSALNHSVVITLVNEVAVRLTIVEDISKVTIDSILPTPMPIRKDGVFGEYASNGIFVVDPTIAGIVPNGPAGKVIVFNNGKKSKPVSHAEPHNIPYQFSIGATMNTRAKKFDWDLQVAKTIGDKINIGHRFKALTKEGHWISVVVAKDKGNKINKIKWEKYC